MPDIRPSLGEILKTYRRLSYSPDSAIAEFVDNSTASYFQIKHIGIVVEQLEVRINYDRLNGTLTITDNAYGMDKKTFVDALTIAKVPEDTSGRNEYGMGMKTAASWFGSRWSVRTKRKGCLFEYSTVVDIDELCSNRVNELQIVETPADKETHYTVVSILEFNNKRKIDQRNFDKLKSRLSSIYRRDICSSDISIYVDGEKLSYESPKVLVETTDGQHIEWKKNLDSKVDFDEEELKYKGFVALRSEGSYKETGFTLLRRGRVIVENYKPREIFGSDNSFQSLRLFGEIDMDEWPVSQAKDKFDWECNGLEEKFVENLKNQIQDYIDKSKLVRKPERIISDVAIKEIAKSTYDDLNKIQEVPLTPISNSIQPASVVVSKPIVTDNNAQKQYSIDIKVLSTYVYHVNVLFLQNRIADSLLSVETGDTEFDISVSFNTSHPFFQELNDGTKFTKCLQKYFIVQIIAEKLLEKFDGGNGLVKPSAVREEIECLLSEIVKDQLTQSYE